MSWAPPPGGGSSHQPQGSGPAAVPGQQGYAGQPYAWHAPAPPPPGRGLAVTALVLSGLALLVSIGVGLWLGLLSSGAAYAPITGEVDAVVGEEVAGEDLEAAIAALHEESGATVEAVSCPGTVTVSEEAVVTCRSVVDGLDWVEHVLFARDGSFTLLRL